ncbi:MAG: hypothetical protein CMJ81_13350 [Planctomycetaceae bacterium]|nr:hypothetical protein [Planctomycetaceae bacterium]
MAKFNNVPLAVVGMACRMPGANDLDEYWELLLQGRCTEAEIPAERFNRQLYFDPNKGVLCKSYASIACLMDYQPIDPSRCPLTPEDLATSDVAHLTICDVAADACRHAAFDPFDMSLRERVGVYIGHVKASELGGEICFASQIEQVAEYLREIDNIDQLTSGRTSDVIREVVREVRESRAEPLSRKDLNVSPHRGAALITKMLRLDGPSMVVNAACASSLASLAMGARALQLGQIDMAIVGGASYCKFDSLVLFSRAQSLSGTGTRPFDEDADGLVNGEGYVTLLIKTLDRALADGDQIHALIRGIGLSTDGKGKSLWAPRKEGQIEAIQRAYGNDLDPSQLQYIEAHATSTQVGDQTELQSLADTLEGKLPPGTKIPIGSVKGNVGHTIETAGMAGLLKTILSMKNGMIPPQPNVKRLNPKIDWKNSPFVVPLEPTPWPTPADGQPRRAAVNSFGIGGLNVHIVLDDGSALSSLSSNLPATKSTPCEPIAILGVGAVLPGARTVEAFWEMLRSGTDGKSQLPVERWDHEVARRHSEHLRNTLSIQGGFVTDFEYDWKTHRVPPKQIATADPLQFMMLDAVEQAMRMAGFHDREFNRKRTGVCVGAMSSGEYHESLQMGLRLPEFKERLINALRNVGVKEDLTSSLADEYQQKLIDHHPSIVDETGSYTTNTLVSRITKAYNLMGGGAAIDSGSTSGSSALTAAMNILQAGDCEMMICTAGHRSMGYMTYEQQACRGVLASDSPPNPLDAQANGFLPGEGTAVVVLKRLSDAQRDGDKVRAIIRGFGVASSDSFQQAMQQAIQRSHQHAAIQSQEVCVVETAAYGVAEADREEIAALAGCYGSQRPQPLTLGTLTSQIGHTGGTAGMAGLLKTVDALEQMNAPANLFLDQVSAAVATEKDCLAVNASSTPLHALTEDGRAIAGVSSANENRVAYHFLVERGEKVPVQETPKSPARQSTAGSAVQGVAHSDSYMPVPDLFGKFRIVRLGAESLPDLVNRVVPLSKSVEDTKLLFQHADAQDRFSPDQRMRMAVVAENPEELHQKLNLAAPLLSRSESLGVLAERGVFCHQMSDVSPRVAFLFPGHGSQYIGMLKSLVECFPPAADAMSKLDARLTQLGFANFSQVAWERGETLGVDVWQTQLALLTADTIVLSALRAMNIQPDCISGHSFGEFPALLAAGAWSFEAAALATHARCSAIENSKNARGIMLSVAAGPEVLERHAADLQGRIHVSVRNAPDQIVVGGEESFVKTLAERLKKVDIVTRVLAAPRAFHTPLMQDTKLPFAEALAQIEIGPPRIPLLSSVTNKYVADPDEIRHNLVAQMTDPVHYDDLIDRLVHGGNNIFVEVGPHQILTKLHRRLLGHRDVVIIGSDQPKRSGLRQLLHVRACLECAGAFSAVHADEAMFGSPALDSRQPESSDSTSEIVPTESAREAEFNVSSDNLSEQPEKSEHQNILTLSGSAYDMGYQMGQVEGPVIRNILQRYANLVGSKWHRLPDIQEDAAAADRYFQPDDLEELRGIADGAGVSHESVIAHNLMLYPDKGSGCSQFAVSASTNSSAGLIHAANEDLPLALSVTKCLRRNVQVRKPTNGIPHVVLGLAGELAGINGMNCRGIAVTSTMLLDLPRRREIKQGRAHNAIVKSILSQADNIDTAIEITRCFCGMGGWSLCISHAPSDEITYLEYDGQDLQVQRNVKRHVSANHCRLHQPVDTPPKHSVHRATRLQQLIDTANQQDVSVEHAQATLRDRFDIGRDRETPHPTMNTIRRVDNQISLVMQPAAGTMWITCPDVEECDNDEYRVLNVNELLTAVPASLTKSNGTRLPASIENVQRSSNNGKLRSILKGEAAQTALQDYGVGPASRNGDVCFRFVMRTVETSEPDSNQTALNGSAIIVGDNSVSRALQQRLQSSGTAAHILAVSDDIDEVLSHLEQMFQDSLVLHLFLLTPYDDNATTSTEESTWIQRRRRGASLPYFVCQRWCQLLLEADALEQATVMAATVMGGDFGFSGTVRSAESGALTGLVKSMKIELGVKTQGRFRAKIVDVSESQSPAEIAATICLEHAVDLNEVEVGYEQDRRLVVRPVVQPIGELSQQEDIPKGGTWVVTGGARGVTAVVARELGKRYGLKLHLIGSSPVPKIDDSWRNMNDAQVKQLRAQVMKEAVARKEVPAATWGKVEKAIEIDKNLRMFREEGVQFTYYATDITDRIALAQVLNEIRKKDGPLEGIVHGAGFESSLRFEKKKRDLVERTIAVKVDGAAALMDLTREDPLRYFLAFGSVSGRFGGLGQTDYGMANDMLCKLVDWFRQQRTDCKSTCFHWHAWDEVGMAVRPESRHLREVGGVTYMPTKEGANHLINEIRAGLPEREILITGWPFHKLNPEYASKVSGGSKAASSPKVSVPPRADSNMTATAVAMESMTAVAVATRPCIKHFPLVDEILAVDEAGGAVTAVNFDPMSEPFLTQHLFKKRPILPAVISMSSVAQATLAVQEGSRFVAAICDVQLLEPMRFHTDRLSQAKVHLEAGPNGVSCLLTSDFYSRAGKLVHPDRPYMKARIELADEPAAPVAEQPPLAPEPLKEFNYPDGVVLYHGEVFRALKEVVTAGDRGWGVIESLDTQDLAGCRQGDQWIIPASAIDAAFYTCGVHVRKKIRGVAKIPKSIERLRVGRSPRVGEKLLAVVRCRELSEQHSVYDFNIHGDDGSVIVMVEGYHGVLIPREG